MSATLAQRRIARGLHLHVPNLAVYWLDGRPKDWDDVWRGPGFYVRYVEEPAIYVGTTEQELQAAVDGARDAAIAQRRARRSDLLKQVTTAIEPVRRPAVILASELLSAAIREGIKQAIARQLKL